MINVSPAISIAVYSALMDQNGFASKAFVLAGRRRGRHAARHPVLPHSPPFDRKPARGSRKGSGGARVRTQEPLTGLQPAARDGRNGFGVRRRSRFALIPIPSASMARPEPALMQGTC